MLDPESLLLRVTLGLVEHARFPARLLALGDAAAVLAMVDGSLVALFTPAFGPVPQIAERMRRLVDENPGIHLKLVLVGGDASLREVLPRGDGLRSRRAVQRFQLERPAGTDRWSLWTGGGARSDSPLGRVLTAAAAGELPAADREALASRVERVEVTPQRRAELDEHRSFLSELEARPYVTWAVLGLLGVVFALEHAWGGSETIPTLVRMGANTADTWAGEPWRLLSSATLHAGLLHVTVNAYVLLVLGGFMEKVLGRSRYAVLLGAAALGGSMASSWWSSSALSVGASGALWGVLGSAAALAWRPGQVVPAAVVGPLRRNAAINLVINLAVSFLPQVDLWAHLGGGVVGAALVASGLLVHGLRRPGAASVAPGSATPSSRRVARWWNIAAVLTASLTLASVAAAWATGRPWELGGEVELHTYALDYGVHLRAPSILGPPRPIDAKPHALVWELGDGFRDPMTILVALTPHGLDAAELQAHVDGFSSRGPLAPNDAELVAGWHRVPGPGWPAFEMTYRYPSGLLGDLRIQLREDVEVQIEVFRWPSIDERWGAALEMVYASVRPPVTASGPTP